jgi:hypothetical protein
MLNPLLSMSKDYCADCVHRLVTKDVLYRDMYWHDGLALAAVVCDLDYDWEDGVRKYSARCGDRNRFGSCIKFQELSVWGRIKRFLFT